MKNFNLSAALGVIFLINVYGVFWPSPVQKLSAASTVVSDVVQLKCSPSRCVWYHKGVLRSPHNGREIAGIEGIELNQFIGTSQTGNAYSSTYLSKKLFVYVDLKNRSAPLSSFRYQRISPLRKVQPVKAFSELVTVGIDVNGDQFTRVEFAGNRTVVSKRVSITPRLEDSSSIQQQSRAVSRCCYDIVHFMSAATTSTAPPQPHWSNRISRWVTFASPLDSSRGKSQEYYTLSEVSRLRRNPLSSVRNTAVTAVNQCVKRLFKMRTNGLDSSGDISSGSKISQSLPSATMHYTRYGEGPSWYSVGRAVNVELNSNRYATVADLPSHAVQLADAVCPEFLTSLRRLDSRRTGTGGSDIASPYLTVDALRRTEVDLLASHRPWYSAATSAISAATGRVRGLYRGSRAASRAGGSGSGNDINIIHSSSSTVVQ